MRFCSIAVITALLFSLPFTAWAHGESVRGVGGAGVNTTGGEVSAGSSVFLRYDLRSYSLFSDDELREYQREGENVHQHSREHSAFLGATFELLTNLDLSIMLQANRFENFTDNGDTFALTTGQLSRTTVSQGLGDMLFLGRYMFFHKSEQHFSLLGGIKLPTGDYRQRTNQGDLVGTHNQPGSGSVDFQLGMAYSGEFGQYVFVGADLLARINSEGAGAFRSGNSIQADLAVGTRLWFLVPSIELNGFFQQQDIELDQVKKNSGVYSVFVTPGLRASFEHHSFFAAVSLPLAQGFERAVISNKELFRFSAGYSLSFGGEQSHLEHPLPPPPPTGGMK